MHLRKTRTLQARCCPRFYEHAWATSYPVPTKVYRPYQYISMAAMLLLSFDSRKTLCTRPDALVKRLNESDALVTITIIRFVNGVVKVIFKLNIKLCMEKVFFLLTGTVWMTTFSSYRPSAQSE